MPEDAPTAIEVAQQLLTLLRDGKGGELAIQGTDEVIGRFDGSRADFFLERGGRCYRVTIQAAPE